jgi:hypothetical protein
LEIKKFLFLRTKENKNDEGYFRIEPELILSNGEILDQDCITCQSVLSKSLGPIFFIEQNKIALIGNLLSLIQSYMFLREVFQ